MILVTLGTQDKSFHRLLEEVERLIEEGIIQDRVVVQAGETKYTSSVMEIFDLIPVTEFNDLIEQASVLITHGGAGSIITGIKNGKKVIAVARREEFGEHTNDHQLQIIEEFATKGYLIPVYEVSELKDAYLKLSDFKPKKFKSNTDHMIKLLEEYIEKNK